MPDSTSAQANAASAPLATEAQAIENDLSQYDFESEPAASSLLQVPERKPVPPSEDRQRDAQGRFLSTADFDDAEPAAAPTIPPPLPLPKPTSRLVRMAQDLGVPDDEIADYSTEQLEAVVHQRHKQLLHRRQRPEPVQEEPEPALPFAEDEFDPKLVGFFKQLQKENLETKKELALLKQIEARRSSDEGARTLDGVFREFKDFVGDETYDQLTPDSVSWKRRAAAVNLANQDASNKSKLQKVRDALKTLYGDARLAAPTQKPATNGAAYDEEVHAKLKAREQDWTEGGLAAPTQRAGASEPKGVPAAKKAFIAGAKKAGFDLVNSYNPNDDEDAFGG